jgi:hypothetical protein
MRRTRRNPVPVTQTEAFRRWFGDSKVVDGAGQPLVVYHGTPDARGLFGADGSGKRGFRTSPTRGDVFFATDDQRTAASYTDPHRAWDYQNSEPAVLPLYLSIQNPLVVDGKFQHWRGTEPTIQKAREAGHDGVIIVNTVDHYATMRGKARREDASTVYAFFSPTQAKSAATGPVAARDFNNWHQVDRSGRTLDFTGPNDGTFDVDDPDLRSNPDDAHVRFVYGARRLARGGFAPVVVEHGDSGKPHQHGGWVAQGYDEDVALAVAKEHAEELASQYIGDWNIEIVPESPSEGRRNPDARITEEEARKKMKGEQGVFRAFDQGARGICTAFEYPDGGVYALHRRRDGKIQGFYHHPPREWEAPRVFVDESPFAPRRNPRIGKMMEAFADLLKTKEDRDPPRPFIEDGKARIDLTYGKRDYEGDLELDILRLKVGRSFVAAAAGELGSRVFAEHNTFTAPKHRGKGYMHLLYTTLLKDGIGIVSDKWNHSLPMRKVWMRLARDGWPVYAFTDEGEDVGGETMTRVPPDVTQDDPLLDEVLVVAPNREAFDRMFGEYGLDEGVAEHLRGGADSVYEGDENEDD